MGTSTNHSSPKTPNWRLANASLGNININISRQSQEIWRAAIADRGDSLADALGDPLLANACSLANKYVLPSLAVQEYERSIFIAHAASLFLDLGRRALARSVAKKTGMSGFASELFAETAGYYASRYLPSFIGAPGRVETVSKAIELKEQILNRARETAKTYSVKSDSQGWKNYILKVLNSLQKGSTK